MISNARPKWAPRTPPLDPPLKPMKWLPRPPYLKRHKASSHPPQEKSARLKNSKKKFCTDSTFYR